MIAKLYDNGLGAIVRHNNVSMAVAICMALGLAGCASTPTSDLTDEEIQVQRLSALAEIEQRRDEIKGQLVDKELHWFATEQVEIAKSSWNRAEEQYLLVAESPQRLTERLSVFNSSSRGVVIDDALNNAIEALNRANVIRAEAQVVLSEAFANDDILQELEAKEQFSEDYIETRRNLKVLVDAIAEDRKNVAVSGLPGVLRSQHKLEVKTVRAIHLTEPKNKLSELERELIHQYAPQTFQSAQSTYNSARAFIAQEPRNQARILEHVAATEFAISHARHIGKDVLYLQAHDVVDYERYLLVFERNLNRIRQALEMDDLRDNSISDQAGLIHKHLLAMQEEQPEVITLREELAQATSELTETLGQLKTAEAELKLELEKNSGYESLIAALQVEHDELSAALLKAEEELLAEEEMSEEEVSAEAADKLSSEDSSEDIVSEGQAEEEATTEIVEVEESETRVVEETSSEVIEAEDPVQAIEQTSLETETDENV